MIQDHQEFALDMLRLSEGLGDDLTSPLQESAVAMRDAVSSNFDYRSTPDGSPWPPRKDDKPHPLLEETGALRRAATEEGAPGHFETIVDRSILEFGVRPGSVKAGGIPFAAIHNDGGRFIPQREFMGVDSGGAEIIGDVFADWLVSQVV